MSLRKFAMRILVGGVFLLGLGATASWWFVAAGQDTASEIKLPKLSAMATLGKGAFDANCASCHGVNATGTDKGPPLIHDIYNPGHHSDDAFYRAAKTGVPQHHWPFGNMPAQPKVSDVVLAAIVLYVRELQVANGILYRPHRM